MNPFWRRRYRLRVERDEPLICLNLIIIKAAESNRIQFRISVLAAIVSISFPNFVDKSLGAGAFSRSTNKYV